MDLVTLTAPASPASEAYRTLRTNIHFSSLDTPLRAILVTSTDPGEGKSTTLANLAVTMAQAGNRVLAVDCDLRRPSLHRLFGLDNAAGLTTMILQAQGAVAGEVSPIRATSVPGLSVLTSGPLPPNPSELLSLPPPGRAAYPAPQRGRHPAAGRAAHHGRRRRRHPRLAASTACSWSFRPTRPSATWPAAPRLPCRRPTPTCWAWC